MSEGGYTGSFTATAPASCSGIASVGPAASTGSFTVTPGNTAGTCSIAFSDAYGQTTQLGVTVSSASVTIHAHTRGAGSH